MPTYTVTISNLNLNSKKQKELAQGITKVHNVVLVQILILLKSYLITQRKEIILWEVK